MKPFAAVAATLAVLTLTGLTLTACSPTVPLQPADDAISPLCAAVSVRLPDTVSQLARRTTNAQATAAWGEPTAVILRCGVPAPGPTASLPCVTVEGIDWLRDDTNDPSFVFTTYGRHPAVEVIINGTAASGLDALTDLSYAVGQLPSTGAACITPG
jgi:hypothetical protein